MKQHGWIALTASLLIAMATACAIAAEGTAVVPKASADDILKNVPDSAVAVMATRSIGEFCDGVQAFVSCVAPEAGGRPIAAGLLEKFVNDTGDGGGLDSSGAMAAAFLLDENNEMKIVVFVPISSYDTWRESWGESIKKDNDEAYEYIESALGKRTYFAPKEGFIVFGGPIEDMELWEKTASTPLSEARRKVIVEAMKDASSVFEASVSTLNKAYPDAATELQSTISEAAGFTSPGKGQIIADTVAKLTGDALSGLDEAVLRLSVSADGIVIHGDVKAVSGMVYGDIFSQQSPVDTSDMLLLPAGANYLGAGGLRGDAAWKYITDFSTQIVAGLAETPEEGETVKALILESLEAMRASGLGENVVGASVSTPSGPLYAAAAIYGAKDAAKGIDALVKIIGDAKMNPVRLKMMKSGKIKIGDVAITDETIGDIQVKVITQKLDFTEADPMEQQMIEKIMGSEIVTRLAAKDGKIYVTSMDDGRVMQELISGKGGVDAEKIKKTLDTLGPNASGVVFISLPGFMAQGMMAYANIGPRAGSGPMAIDVPTTSQYAGAAVFFSANAARFTVSIPTEEILAAKAVLGQLMSRNFGMMEEDESLSTDSSLEEDDTQGQEDPDSGGEGSAEQNTSDSEAPAESE